MNVLFVDDHVACADMFADIAEGLGHRACVAHDAVSARQRCSEETFDLILMDISLPDGDGRDVCCELRRSAQAQNTRIVALTGHADLKGSSCMSDFDGCIVKPIAMQALEDLLGADITGVTGKPHDLLGVSGVPSENHVHQDNSGNAICSPTHPHRR